MSEWRETADGVTWSDAGEIELKFEDGSIVRAYLSITADSDGMGGTGPVPEIFDGDGAELGFGFHEADFWREAQHV